MKAHHNRGMFLVASSRFVVAAAVAVALVLSFLLATSSPYVLMKLFFDANPLPEAGPGSIYVPGAGFSGFWYHLGYFAAKHQRDDLHLVLNANVGDVVNDAAVGTDEGRQSRRDFYCYSSGCLGLVLAALNVNVDTVVAVATSMQLSWRNGRLSSYDLVSVFLGELLLPVLPLIDHGGTAACSSSSSSSSLDDDDVGDAITRHNNCSTTATATSTHLQRLDAFLPRLHILVTTLESSNGGGGVVIAPHARTATTHAELLQLLKQTTHIPWVTGPAAANTATAAAAAAAVAVLDGGFSRAWHPGCETTVAVPLTWSTVLHSLNPGLDHGAAAALYRMGATAAAIGTTEAGGAATDGEQSQPALPPQ